MDDDPDVVAAAGNGGLRTLSLAVQPTLLFSKICS